MTRLFFSTFLALFSFTLPAAPLATAFTYQGELVQGGTAVTGACDFNFGLWDAAINGVEVATDLDVLNVNVNEGVFTVELDFGAGVFDGDARWLAIAVVCPASSGDLTLLAPRQALTAAPHALFALEAAGMDWTGLRNVPADLADGDDVIDADADPNNELQSLAGVLALGNDAGGVVITNLLSPTAAADAATMAYVDAHTDGDSDSSNELQNLFATVSSDNGETTANVQADTLNVVGAGSVSTAIVGDTLTINGSGISSDVGDPVLAGSLGIGTGSRAVFVSGRYAYVINSISNDLKVIDVSDPGTPSLVGSLVIGTFPRSVYVSGRYAYVVDSDLDDLKVIDVSDPSAPSLAGSLSIGSLPFSVYVSGRYAYVADSSSRDLKVIDVSDPGAPSLVGVLGITGLPTSVYVSGRYAYVLNDGVEDLKVIDVSDPSTPSVVGMVDIGPTPISVYVSGRYAYVIDITSDDLKVIDVSDPSMPSLAGSLDIGEFPQSVYVSGRYAYVVDTGSDDLKVIDVSDPSAPSLVGSLDIGTAPVSVYVSGRYAYVVDAGSTGLTVIDVSGTEFPSLIAHSLEAGNLQVRNDIIAQGQLQVTGGINVGAGGIYTDGNVGIAGILAIANDKVPATSPANLVQLYAVDVSASSELRVRDEAGMVTTLSPHNFSLIGKPSEPMAWSFYSENDQGRINVDMLRAMRIIESMSGVKLVYTEAKVNMDIGSAGGVEEPFSEPLNSESLLHNPAGYPKLVMSFIMAVEKLEADNDLLRADNEALERRLEALERRLN